MPPPSATWEAFRSVNGAHRNDSPRMWHVVPTSRAPSRHRNGPSAPRPEPDQDRTAGERGHENRDDQRPPWRVLDDGLANTADLPTRHRGDERIGGAGDARDASLIRLLPRRDGPRFSGRACSPSICARPPILRRSSYSTLLECPLSSRPRPKSPQRSPRPDPRCDRAPLSMPKTSSSLRFSSTRACSRAIAWFS